MNRGSIVRCSVNSAPTHGQQGATTLHPPVDKYHCDSSTVSASIARSHHSPRPCFFREAYTQSRPLGLHTSMVNVP